MSEKIQTVTVAELCRKWWWTGISDREELNALDFDQLLDKMGVEIAIDDTEPVHISDCQFDKIHKEYRVDFARGGF